jgi:hypothetical protein
MKRWLLAAAASLLAIEAALADYVIIIANVGGQKAGGGDKGPMGGPGVGGPMGGPMGGPAHGGPGGGPMFGGTGGFEQAVDVEPVPQLVAGVLEMDNLNLNLQQFKQGAQPVVLYHRWGGGAHIFDGDVAIKNLDKLNVGVFLFSKSTQGFVPLPNIQKRFDEEKGKMPPKPTPDRVLALAEWALQHGLVEQFQAVMDKFAEEEKSHQAAVAYVKVREGLKTKPPANKAGWRARPPEGFREVAGDHYVVWHNLADPAKGNVFDEVRPRLNRLEHALKVYYYWWALRGVELPLPKEKMLAILDKDADSFRGHHELFAAKRNGTGLPVEVKAEIRRHHEAFTDGPEVAGGFYSRRENVVVLSDKRLDAAYTGLEGATNGIWETVGAPHEVMRGEKWDPRKNLMDQTYKITQSDAEMKALLLRVLENDAERAGASHNASRQLVIASGLLPANVAAPEWVQFGLGSFFETPLGSPWLSPTAPSTLHLPELRRLKKETDKKGGHGLEEKPVDTLRMVVTDGYFRQTLQRPDKVAALKKARATAWGLTYYLMYNRRDGFQKFLAELSRQPRDMEIDDDVLLACFARSFGCWDQAKQRPDMDALAGLATSWYKAMNDAPLEAQDIGLLDAIKHEELKFQEAALKGNPMGPRDPRDPRDPRGPMGPIR